MRVLTILTFNRMLKISGENMAILGITLSKIEAKMNANATPSGDININSSPTISNVTKRDMDLYNMKDVLAVDFKFDISYDPDVGKISMEGELLYQTDKAKEIVNKWKKDKKMEDEQMAVEILNAIFRKCLTQSVTIAHELRLPPPIAFPMVRPKDK